MNFFCIVLNILNEVIIPAGSNMFLLIFFFIVYLLDFLNVDVIACFLFVLFFKFASSTALNLLPHPFSFLDMFI